jgi:hypothetical protein
MAAIERSDLTVAQRNALRVLAANPDKFLRANRRSTQDGPRPRLNMRAAAALVDKGLARIGYAGSHVWMEGTHNERYRITDAGLATHRAMTGDTSSETSHAHPPRQ